VKQSENPAAVSIRTKNRNEPKTKRSPKRQWHEAENQGKADKSAGGKKKHLPSNVEGGRGNSKGVQSEEQSEKGEGRLGGTLK